MGGSWSGHGVYWTQAENSGVVVAAVPTLNHFTLAGSAVGIRAEKGSMD